MATVTPSQAQDLHSRPASALIVVPIIGSVILWLTVALGVSLLVIYYYTESWHSWSAFAGKQLVWRRFEQDLTLELHGVTLLWLLVLGVLLVLTLVYLVWSFVREARTQGAPWAAFRASSRFLILLGLIALYWFVLAPICAGLVKAFGGGQFTVSLVTLLVVAGLVLYHVAVPVYVVWRFLGEGRSAGWHKAPLLAILRITVYLVLPLVFLFKAFFFKPGAGQPIVVLRPNDMPWLPYVFWLAVLMLVLLLGAFYVGWTYFRDSRSAGGAWSFFLGSIRLVVYFILAGVFLLPGCQSWEETKTQSRVVLAFDVSPSMVETRDDPLKPGVQFKQLPTRQDKLIAFLMKKQEVLAPHPNPAPGGRGDSDFVEELRKKSPLYLYRWGSALDERCLVMADGKVWWREALGRTSAQSPEGEDRRWRNGARPNGTRGSNRRSRKIHPSTWMNRNVRSSSSGRSWFDTCSAPRTQAGR